MQQDVKAGKEIPIEEQREPIGHLCEKVTEQIPFCGYNKAVKKNNTLL